jgi:hypothetical protein
MLNAVPMLTASLRRCRSSRRGTRLRHPRAWVSDWLVVECREVGYAHRCELVGEPAAPLERLRTGAEATPVALDTLAPAEALAHQIALAASSRGAGDDPATRCVRVSSASGTVSSSIATGRERAAASASPRRTPSPFFAGAPSEAGASTPTGMFSRAIPAAAAWSSRARGARSSGALEAASGVKTRAAHRNSNCVQRRVYSFSSLRSRRFQPARSTP